MDIFSRSEVLRHNTKSDCWIIVKNGVYNITEFVARHPGGADILLARAGEDASSYFITKHANDNTVQKHLERFKIGELASEERISAEGFDEPFITELLELCHQKKLYHIPTWFKNPYFYIRGGNLLLFFAFSVLALHGNFAWFWTIPMVILQAMIGVSLFGFVAHESTHRNFPRHPFLRFALRITWPIFWPFISQQPLRYEHNSHHIKIGDPELDYEVAGFASVVRYSGLVEHSPIHASQHKLARFLYPFYANIITTIGGIKSGFWERHNRQVGMEHGLSIVASLFYFIALPSLIHGDILWYILLYLIYQCTLFYGVYLTAAINHFVPPAMQPIPSMHENKYGYYVCHNTSNFCTDSYFWFWLSGGFNIQIEHHLISFIPVENLRKMIPIVKKLCIQHGYPYNHYDSMGKLWQEHYTYLSGLSNEQDDEFVKTEIRNKKSYQAR